MQLIIGNLWDFHVSGAAVCVTTNTVIKNNGELVMGAGVAKQAKLRFPDLPAYAGKAVRQYNDAVIYCPPFNLFLFPTKHDWRQPSKLDLIERSAHGLRTLTDYLTIPQVYLTRPGCGNGGLSWGDVMPVLANHLNDDRFFVVVK